MKKLLTIAAILLAATQIYAQSVPFLNVNADPYSHSMGGATLTLEQNAFTMSNNSSAMVFSENKFHIGGAYNSWQPDFMDNQNIGFAAYGSFGKWAIGVGGKLFNYQPYDIVSSGGITNGSFTPSENAIEGAIAFKLSNSLSVGVNVRTISSKLGEEISASGFGADVSLTYHKEKFTIAAAVTNLGGEINYGGETSYALPTIAKAGAGFALLQSDKQKLKINIEGKLLLEQSVFMTSAGAEYLYGNTLRLRAGYHMGNDEAIPSYGSAGIGLQIGALNIDAAYIVGGGENSVLNGSFGVALGLKF